MGKPFNQIIQIHNNSKTCYLNKPKYFSTNVQNTFKPFYLTNLYLEKFSNLDDSQTIKTIKNKFKGKALIYGIQNNLNNKIYIGSTTNAYLRFHSHFIVAGRTSNIHLQRAIKLRGLNNFTLYIITVLELPENMAKAAKRDLILTLEQKYIDFFPKEQLYNLLFVAGSMYGYKHSEASKLLMSINSKGIEPVNKGVKGVKLTNEQKLFLRSKMTHRFKPVYFYDELGNLLTMYDSFSETRRQEKCRSNLLLECIKTGKLFRGFKVSYEYKN